MVSESAPVESEGAPVRMRPLSQRLHDAYPVPPWQVGALLFLALTGVFFVLEIALGRHRLIADLAPDDPGLRNVRLAILMFLALSYAIAVSLHLVRRERESLAELLPHLRIAPAEAAELRELPGRFRRAALWRGGLIGIAIALLVPILADPIRDLYDPREWDFEMYWHRILVFGLGWWLGRVTVLVVTQSLRMRALVERLPELDLFDPAPLRPFATMVSAHALVLAGVAGIFSLNLLEERFGAMVGVLLVMIAGLASLAVFGPLRGIRDRIVAAKRRALVWCRAELAAAAEALEQGRAQGAGRVADLVAYERRVEAVHEWPFDARMLRRLGFYLLIPLISWSGGALVERVIDALLD